jgi:peptide/nickel transport system permease protein
MLRFVARRLVYGVLQLFVIATAAYWMLYAAAGNVARTLLGPDATAATVAAKNQALGLNSPLPSRYLNWLGHAVTGNFGDSWTTGAPVASSILSRLEVTLTLVLGAIVVAAVLSAVLGVWAALRGGWVDRLVQVFSVLGFAVPGFLVAVFLVRAFALGTHWFKPTGYVPLGQSFPGWLQTVTLPVIALSLGTIAGVAQQIRGSVLDTLRQDWVRTLRSRGLPERRILFKHVLRNAGGPALSVLALSFVGLLGGAVIVEEIFGIPGVGQVSVASTTQSDIPMVMGLVVAIGILVILVNLAIDILQGFLNPKARIS